MCGKIDNKSKAIMELRIWIFVALLCIASGNRLAGYDASLSFPPEDIEHIKNHELYVLDDNGKPVRLTWNPEAEAAGESDIDILKNIKDRVNFYLYTKKNPKNAQTLMFSDVDSLRRSNFDARKPTKFITHGWINSHKSPSCQLVREAYLKHGDYNVILVGWSKISVRPYSMAFRNVKNVGQHVAKMIDFLQTQGMNLGQTTLVGHSLGAHVVGLAGHYAKGIVNYIVGLDPALPGFSRASPGQRISVQDGKHVEIIHTNAGLLGYISAIGHADFYPNGGLIQRGCVADIGGVCSHLRAYEFFAESITSSVGFYGTKCSSYQSYKRGKCKNGLKAIMGGYKKVFWANGSYYLDTHPNRPFAMGR